MVEGLGLSLATLRLAGSDRQKLRDACNEMESMFVYMLLKEMDNTLSHDDLFSSGREEAIFRDMKNLEVSREVAKDSVLGISDLLYKSFERFI